MQRESQWPHEGPQTPTEPCSIVNRNCNMLAWAWFSFSPSFFHSSSILRSPRYTSPFVHCSLRAISTGSPSVRQRTQSSLYHSLRYNIVFIPKRLKMIRGQLLTFNILKRRNLPSLPRHRPRGLSLANQTSLLLLYRQLIYLEVRRPYSA